MLRDATFSKTSLSVSTPKYIISDSRIVSRNPRRDMAFHKMMPRLGINEEQWKITIKGPTPYIRGKGH